MTLNDLLKRIPKEDYDKCIIISDGKGWTNVDNNIEIGASTITLFEDKNPYQGH